MNATGSAGEVIAICDKLFGDHARQYDLSVRVEFMKVLVYTTQQQELAAQQGREEYEATVMDVIAHRVKVVFAANEIVTVRGPFFTSEGPNSFIDCLLTSLSFSDDSQLLLGPFPSWPNVP